MGETCPSSDFDYTDCLYSDAPSEVSEYLRVERLELPISPVETELNRFGKSSGRTTPRKYINLYHTVR